jgi:hypothetical protein
VQTLATLAAALGLSAPVLVPGAATAPDADAHAAITGIADRLLQRVAAVTATLQQSNGPLSESEQLAARLLLSDLSLLGTAWQAVGTMSAGRLDHAAERLVQARGVLDKALRAQETADSSVAAQPVGGAGRQR